MGQEIQNTHTGIFSSWPICLSIPEDSYFTIWPALGPPVLPSAVLSRRPELITNLSHHHRSHQDMNTSNPYTRHSKQAKPTNQAFSKRCNVVPTYRQVLVAIINCSECLKGTSHKIYWFCSILIYPFEFQSMTAQKGMNEQPWGSFF